MKAARRQARTLVLQALYETDTVHHDPQQVIDNRLVEDPAEVEGESFARRLFFAVLENKAQLDATIQQHAPEWPLEQVAVNHRHLFERPLGRMLLDNGVQFGRVFEHGEEEAPRK